MCRGGRCMDVGWVVQEVVLRKLCRSGKRELACCCALSYLFIVIIPDWAFPFCATCT